MKRARPETPRVIIGDNLSGSIKRGGGNTQNDTLFHWPYISKNKQ